MPTMPVGTAIRYRAVLREPDGTRVSSAVRSVDQDRPEPLVNSVTVAGDSSPRSAVPADWDPACADSHLTFDTSTVCGRGPGRCPPDI